MWFACALLTSSSLGALVQGGYDPTVLSATFDAVEKFVRTKELLESFRRLRVSVQTSMLHAKTDWLSCDSTLILSIVDSRPEDDEWISAQ